MKNKVNQDNIVVKGRSLIEKFYAHLFFVFFVAQILSPSIGDRTIYLEILVAVLNPFFIFWIKKQPIKEKYFFLYMSIIAILAIGNIFVAIKLFSLSISVLFLFYAYFKNLFFIKPYIILSIILAIFQLYFTFFNPELARLIGPENIATAVWGEYATATFTNFYTVFWFPRVSGLSREAGFFASLLVAYIFLVYLYNKNNKTSSSYFYKILLTIGYVISFSKMSLVLFLVYFVEKIKFIINKIPLLFTIVLFTITMIWFWSSNITYLLDCDNVTFLHRFGGYPSLLNVDLIQLLFGIDKPSEINTVLAQTVEEEFSNFAGFAGFILHNGILVLLFMFLGLYVVGVTSSGILILLFLTINVQLDTNQNFVVLAYFIVLKFYSNKKIVFRRL